MYIICSGDQHLDGARTPVNRKDDYVATQKRKMKFINDLVDKYDAIHLGAGDVLDVAVGQSVGDAVLTLNLINEVLRKFYTVLGNHDLRNKALEYLSTSIINVPIQEGRITHLNGPYELTEEVVLHGFNYGQQICHRDSKYDGKVNIAVYHGFVDQKENTLIGGVVAKDILEEFYQDYDFIITADHHKSFVEEYKGSVLINTGCLLRNTIKQIDHKPCVWLINTDTKEYEPIYIPIENSEDVISLERAEEVERREESIETFITYFGNAYEVTKSFTQNMIDYLKVNNKFVKDGVEMEINSNVKSFIDKCTSEEEYRYDK